MAATHKMPTSGIKRLHFLSLPVALGLTALLALLWLLGVEPAPAARAHSPIVGPVSPADSPRCNLPDSPCAALPDFAGESAPAAPPAVASTKPVAAERAAGLAALTVNVFTDDISTNGNCTLREAIIAANENRIVDACPTGVPGPDVITLTAGVYSLRLPGTGEDAGYTGDLDVAEALTVVGAGSGLTVIDAGGLDRVFNIFGGPVELVGLTLQNGGNVDNGGGIFNAGTLKLTDVIITGNLAISSVVPTVGGGIDNAGTLEMTDSAISFNTARATGSTNFSDGGGLHSSGPVTLTRTLINNNQADSVAGAIGGGIFNEMSLITLADSRVLNNSAHEGGGLYNWGNVVLRNSRVSSNTATVGAGLGGGIVNKQRLVLTGSLVSGNWAQLGAGGIWNKLATSTVQINNSSVAGNTVFGGDGGGIVNSGWLTATGTNIETNAALSGGGIHNMGTLFLKNSKLVLNGSTLTSGGGGGLLNFGQMRLESSQVFTNSATNLGGGAFNGVPGTLVFSNTTVQANSAITGGGGIYNNSGAQLEIEQSSVSRNQLTGSGAGVGGAGLNSAGTALLRNSTLSSNYSTATAGGALVSGGTLTVTFSTVASNTATGGSGHGILVTSGAAVVQNSIVAHNGTSNCGGAVNSLGHNLSSDTSCTNFAATGDLTATNPLIGQLQNNIGDTETHALLPGSPAIDAGFCLPGINVDQRGFPRPGSTSSLCDSGSFEEQGVQFDLQLSKHLAASTVISPNQAITYTLIYTNAGPGLAAGVFIDDLLPAEIFGAAFLQAGSVVTHIGSLPFLWQVEDLAPGQGGIITVTGFVAAATPVGTLITNTATITHSAGNADTQPANNVSSAHEVFVGSPGAVFTETGGSTVVAEGGASDSVEMALTAPPISPVRVDISTDGQTLVLPSALTFTNRNWSAPQTMLVFAVNDSVPEYFHTGQITITGSSADPNYGSGQMVLTAVITDDDVAADLQLDKIGPSAVVLGQKINYTIKVTNNGPWPATSVRISDTLPGGNVGGLSAAALPVDDFSVQFDPPRPSGELSAMGITCNSAGNLYWCNVDELQPGGGVQLSLETTPTGQGTLLNMATTQAAEADPGPQPNTDSVTTTVSGANVDLVLSKQASAGSVQAGQIITFSLAVTNTGLDTAFGVTLFDSLPAGFATTGWVATTLGACSASDSAVSCGLGTMLPSTAAQVTFSAVPTLAFNVPTLVTNTATANAAVGTDLNPADNSASAAVTVQPATTDLSISKNVSAGPVLAGQTLTYSLVVVQPGPDSIAGVTVVDALPAGVVFGSATAGQGSCRPGTPVTCQLGTVTPGSVPVTITVTAAAPGIISNTASVTTALAFDTNPGNNTSLPAVTTVQPAVADLQLSKVASSGQITVGHSLVYTLSITNSAGSDPAAGVVVTDTLPTGLVFSRASAGAGSCAESGGTVTCNLGTLAAGQNRQVVVWVTPTLVATVTNRAAVTLSFGSEVNPLDNRDAVTVSVAGVSGVATPQVGATLIYTDAQGNPTQIEVPAGAVTASVRLRLSPIGLPAPAPPGSGSVGHIFSVEAFTVPGDAPLAGFVFSRPITISIRYSTADLAAISDESTLVLYYLSQTGWLSAATTCRPALPVHRDLAAHRVVAAVCHLTDFALFGASNVTPVYLPIILKEN